MDATQHGSDDLRRVPPGQRERLTDDTPPAERDAVIGQVRREHLDGALAQAVAAGGLSPVSAQEILDRLSRGEDPHVLRRQLRAAGVLNRLLANARHDEGDGIA